MVEGRRPSQLLVLFAHFTVAELAHESALPVELDGAVAELGDLAAEHVVMKSVLVRGPFVRMERDGCVDFAVVEVLDVTLAIVFVVFMEQLLHLIRPDTLRPAETANTPSYFYVFVCGVHLSEAFADMRHHPPENLSAEDHARSSHAEVLPGLQPQLSKFFSIAQARLSQVERLAAI